MSVPRGTYKGMTIIKDRRGFRVVGGKVYQTLGMATAAIDIKKFASKK